MSAELSVNDIKLAMYEVTFRVSTKLTAQGQIDGNVRRRVVQGGMHLETPEGELVPLNLALVSQRVVTLDGAYGDAVRTAGQAVQDRYVPLEKYVEFIGLDVAKIELIAGGMPLCPVAATSLREARE